MITDIRIEIVDYWFPIVRGTNIMFKRDGRSQTSRVPWPIYTVSEAKAYLEDRPFYVKK